MLLYARCGLWFMPLASMVYFSLPTGISVGFARALCRVLRATAST